MNLNDLQNRMGQIVEEQRSLYAKPEFTTDDDAKDKLLDNEFRSIEAKVQKIKENELRSATLAKLQFEAEKGGSKAKNGVDELRALRGILSNDPTIMSELRAAQSSAVAADGGFTVPVTLMNEIEKGLKAFGGLRAVARVLTTSTGEILNFPTVDDTAKTGTIKDQNADNGSAVKVVFGNVPISAYKLSSGVLQIPRELITDSQFDINTLLAELIVERVARLYSAYLVTGTGTAEPQGVVTGAGVGVSAAASAITADNVLDLIASVDRAYRGSSSFGVAMNDATETALRKLKDGNGQYLWQMGDIKAGTPSSIWNTPIIVDNGFASIGTGSVSMVAGDFSKLIVREVGSGVLARSEERYFEFDQVGVMFTRRVDSKVINAGAIKKLTHA